MAHTISAKPGEFTAQWYEVDADGQVLGRLASSIAYVLQGKHQPHYTPHVDTGDFVVVVNCGRVKLTGQKREKSLHHYHTGYPGGIRSRTKAEELDGRDPTVVLYRAVRRMLPKGPLGRAMLKKLKLYAASTHPHAAQQVAPLPERLLHRKPAGNAN